MNRKTILGVKIDWKILNLWFKEIPSTKTPQKKRCTILDFQKNRIPKDKSQKREIKEETFDTSIILTSLDQ